MPKVNNIVICDDVRREDNGKHILVGVYGADIVPGALPGGIVLERV